MMIFGRYLMDLMDLEDYRGPHVGAAVHVAPIRPLRLWGRGATEALELSSRGSGYRAIGILDRHLSLSDAAGIDCDFLLIRAGQAHKPYATFSLLAFRPRYRCTFTT
jgi:hypothetical protein